MKIESVFQSVDENQELTEEFKDNFKELITVLNSFVGSFREKIPLYSAVHVNGKRLYEYAHNKEEVILPLQL